MTDKTAQDNKVPLRVQPRAMKLFIVLSVCLAVSTAYPNLVDLANANNATTLVGLLNSAGLADILKDPSQGIWNWW